MLFVCLGNICRSPTAEAVFRSKVQRAGLDSHIDIDSAGTGDWHIGRAPDPRAIEHASQAGYDLDNLRARLVSEQDFSEFDYILAMDRQNLADLKMMRPPEFEGVLDLFLNFDSEQPIDQVPDPYSGGESAFRQVIDLIECGSDALIEQLRQPLKELATKELATAS